MSKSLGTGVDPLNLIEAFGADATRFGIIWQMMSNQDIRWDETAVLAGKSFVIKSGMPPGLFWRINLRATARIWRAD